jgi:outer membrane protein TolC
MKNQKRIRAGRVVASLLALAALQVAAESAQPKSNPADRIVDSVTDRSLRTTLEQTLSRNPELTAAEARAEAELHRAPQVRALPDPQAELTAYLLPPETRVGPQRVAARFSQRLPGFGKLKLREQAAVYGAEEAEAELQALRLRLITEVRRLYYEIAYLEASREAIRADRGILDHFEELARARYSAGVGIQKDVIQIQAEITRLDVRLAAVAAQRASRIATLNRLRDRPAAPVDDPFFPDLEPLPADWDALRVVALSNRPEVRAVEARIARSQVLQELASKEGSPEFSVGLTYAYVERRSDADPPDNGQDVLGISGGITLPVWRQRIAAGVEQAAQQTVAGEADRRAIVTAIDHELEDLRGRIPEIERQLELFSGVLMVQSEQALRSAEAAYATGRVDGLALLDAERVLLDVRLAAERTRADLAIARARLEGAIGAPLESVESPPMPASVPVTVPDARLGMASGIRGQDGELRSSS